VVNVNQNSFGLSNVLNCISKTLNLSNHVIPLYQQVSPMVKNVSNVVSNINKSGLLKRNNIKNNVSLKQEKVQKKELSLNNPVFFH